MENVNKLFNDAKLNRLKNEYNTIQNKDILLLYNHIIEVNEDKLDLYFNEVYLLMSEYLPIESCPFMREYIRCMYQYKDSYQELDNLDIDNIKKSNIQLIEELLLNEEFKNAYDDAVSDNPAEKLLLEMIKSCISNNTVIVEDCSL